MFGFGKPVRRESDLVEGERGGNGKRSENKSEEKSEEKSESLQGVSSFGS
jgi:hypothetical protein